METKLIQVRMREGTIFQADRLRKNIHAPSRSDAIRRAIELSDTLTTAIKHGDKIVIEGKNGKKQVIIPGLDEE